MRWRPFFCASGVEEVEALRRGGDGAVHNAVHGVDEEDDIENQPQHRDDQPDDGHDAALAVARQVKARAAAREGREHESGVMRTGWLDLGGKKYYLDASGAMYAGITFEMDGNTWQAAADGSCTVVLPEENAAGNGGSTDGQTPITGSQSPVQPSGPAGV